MSCLRFITERIGGMSAAAVRQGDRLSCSAVSVDHIQATAVRQGGILCRVYQECRTNREGTYLELDPEIVWILAGSSKAYNDVISNTSWYIEH